MRKLAPLFFLFLGLVTASAQKNYLVNLKSWVGKYPTDKESKPQRDFFKLTEIRGQLNKLLGKRDFDHLTKDLEVESQIECIKGYLIVAVCKSHCCPCDNAMLAINLDNGTLHVGFYESHDENKSSTRWFGRRVFGIT